MVDVWNSERATGGVQSEATDVPVQAAPVVGMAAPAERNEVDPYAVDDDHDQGVVPPAGEHYEDEKPAPQPGGDEPVYPPSTPQVDPYGEPAANPGGEPAAEPGGEPFEEALDTVASAKEYAAQHPDRVDDLVAAEREGKGRAGILALSDKE